MRPRGRLLRLWLFQFAADLYAVTAAYYTTLWIRFHTAWGIRMFESLRQAVGVHPTDVGDDVFEVYYLVRAPRIILVLVVMLCVLYALQDLYPARRFIRRRPVAWNVVSANLLAMAFVFAYFYLRRNIFHPRSFFLLALSLNTVFCVSFRAGLDRVFDALRRRFGLDTVRAVLVGTDGEVGFLKVLLDEVHPHGIRIAAQVVPLAGEAIERIEARVEAAAREAAADMLIFAEKRLSVAELAQMLNIGDRLDVSVKVLSDKLDVLVTRARMAVDRIGGVPLVHFDAPSHVRRGAPVRLAVYWLASAAAALLLAPLGAVVAALIRGTSPGPVFFVQERIGVNRRPFLMFKFRTMYDRAEEIQAQMEEFNESGAGLFKMRRDPRVTPVGRFLRRFSLDELPQLLNVLRGEMTLVGPRPLPRRDFQNYYEEWHYGRHGGMPGLTCLWQVSGRSELGFHDMCVLDVYYLRNQGWTLDLKILLKTVWVVLFAKGAY